MDEILELRACMEAGRYDDALLIINEMEEMAKDDKLNKIYSYAVVLLLHLAKQHAEKRTTRSWDLSVRNATEDIQRVNKRRKADGTYAASDELREILADALPQALRRAAQEAFEGRYDETELAAMLDQKRLLDEAFALIKPDTRL
jgi:plasmid stability protein